VEWSAGGSLEGSQQLVLLVVTNRLEYRLVTRIVRSQDIFCQSSQLIALTVCPLESWEVWRDRGRVGLTGERVSFRLDQSLSLLFLLLSLPSLLLVHTANEAGTQTPVSESARRELL
jgi:hypothetical protein